MLIFFHALMLETRPLVVLNNIKHLVTLHFIVIFRLNLFVATCEISI